jgi:MFS family permease
MSAANDASTARTRPYPSAAIAWYGMAVFVFAQLVHSMDRGIVAFVVEPIKHDLHITDVQISLLTGLAFGVFYTTVGLALGMMADVISRRRLLIAGILTWSLATMACGLAQSFPMMFAARLFVGLGEATLGPCVISMIGDLFPAVERGRPMSVYALGTALSNGLAITITGAIIGLPAGAFAAFPVLRDLAHWRIAFVLCGGLGLVTAAMLFAMPEVKRTGAILADRAGLGIGQVARYLGEHRSVFLPYYAGYACYQAGATGVAAWSAPFLTRHFHLTLPIIGARLGALTMVLAVIGALAAGLCLTTVIKRDGIRGKMRLASLLPLLVLPAAFLALAPTPWVAFFLIATPTLMLPLLQATLAGTISELMPANMRGIAVALYAFSGTMIGGTLGPLFVALVTDHLWRDPAKVGWSILVVAIPAFLLSGALMLTSGANLDRLRLKGARIEGVLAANEAPRV